MLDRASTDTTVRAPLVKITNLRAERARRDVPQGSNITALYFVHVVQSTGAVPSTAPTQLHPQRLHPTATFPAPLLGSSNPCLSAVTCQSQLPSVTRHPSPVTREMRHAESQVAPPSSPALLRHDGCSMSSHAHQRWTNLRPRPRTRASLSEPRARTCKR